MATIGIGTGKVLSDDNQDVADWLEFLRSIGVEGVEIGLGDEERVREFESDVFVDFRDEFDFYTLHGPFRSHYDVDDIELIYEVENIREQVGAERVVYHPDRISSLDLVADVSPVAIEGMQVGKQFGRTKFDAMMQDVDTPIVIDTAHAATWETDETAYLYDTYNNRISHFHVSALGEEEHDPFFEYPEFLDDDLVSMLSGHKLIIESRLTTRDEVRREVDTLRTALE